MVTCDVGGARLVPRLLHDLHDDFLAFLQQVLDARLFLFFLGSFPASVFIVVSASRRFELPERP